MGVSGAGKTTVGRLLAERLGWAFHDGDDLHPDANVRKMASGIPLTDDDRWPWLERIGSVMRRCDDAGRHAVVACSALRERYRVFLAGQSGDVAIVFLRGDRKTIRRRVEERDGHFMPPDLLDSQFDSLEEPRDAVVVDVAGSPEEIVGAIVSGLRLPA